MAKRPVVYQTKIEERQALTPTLADQFLYWIILIAVGVTPIFFHTSFTSVFELPRFILVCVLALAGLAAIGWHWWRVGMIVWPKTVMDIPLALFLGLAGISTVLSMHPYTSLVGYFGRFNGGLISYVAYVVLFYVAVIALKSLFSNDIGSRWVQRRRRIMWVWLSCSVIASVVATLQHLDIPIICWLTTGVEGSGCWANPFEGRVSSVLGNPTFLSAYMVMVIPVGISLLLTAESNVKRWIALILTVFAYAGLWFSYTRAGWVGLAFVVVVLVMIVPWRSWLERKWWIAGLVALCGLISLTSFDTAVSRTEVSTSQDGVVIDTVETRILLWQGSLEIIRQKPLMGTGPATFAYSFEEIRPKEMNDTIEWHVVFEKAHNEVLDIAANMGIPAMLTWLGAFLLAIFVVLRARYAPHFINKVVDRLSPDLLDTGEPSIDDRIVTAAILSSLVGVFAAQLLGFSIVATNVLFFVGLAILIAPKSGWYSFDLPSAVRLAAGVVMIVIVMSAGVLLFRFSAANSASERGEKLANTKVNDEQSAFYVLQESINAHTLAIEHNPFQQRYYQNLARQLTKVAGMVSDEKQRAALIESADWHLAESHRRNPYDLRTIMSEANGYSRLASYDQKYQEDAVRLLLKAVKMAPTSATVFDAAGDYFSTIGEDSLALEYLNKAVELRPNAPAPYIQRAKHFLRVNNQAEAKADIQQAIELDPDNEEASELMDQLEVN